MDETIVQKKTSRLIQQELSDIFAQEMNVAPGAIFTISVVRLSPDLGSAKIYVSLFPDAGLDALVLRLNEQTFEIRHFLSKRIRNKLRKMPDLRFYADDSFQEAEQMNRLISSLDIPAENDDE
ncbi:MAG: 30S ribosome-binding factor RbfA [Bacteroidetes bacterium]|nr:MAG: 30S ribosome-binding factor RbfA [Bacteroidota bacterium]